MNKNSYIYIIVSIIVVLGVSLFVLAPDSEEDNITITVMNSDTIISETETYTSMTIMSCTTSYEQVSDTCVTETTMSSISTNAETTTVITEPVYEEVYVNINTADLDELMKINGIGEVKANDIICYREQNGGFRNIEEIMNVSGIGKTTFWNICDYIYVENPVYETEDIIEEIPEEITEPEIQPETFIETETEPLVTLEDIAPININTADIELLMFLPYVDEQIAQDIITLREQIHGFSHVYELLYVEKLAQNQVAEIVKFVTVGQ